MYRKSVEFNVVSIEQRHVESLIVFEINKVSSIVKQTNVGQLIQSSVFELNNVSSIGKSKWVVLLFLNGQYDHGGTPNEHICVYLKMIHCERQSNVFKIDVKFQLGSEYATVTMNNQSLCYDDVRARWIGTKLIKINEMIINGNRFIQNDTLLLSVHLNEHLSPTKFGSMPYENECRRKTDNSCDKVWTETMEYDHGSPPRASTILNQSSNDTIYNTTNRNNTSNVASGTSVLRNHSTRSSRQSLPNSIAFYDDNFNYVGHHVNNEFSDDEDNASKPNSPKSGFFSGLFNGIRKLL